MTTQQTHHHEPDTQQQSTPQPVPVPTQRRRRGRWPLLDAAEPIAPAIGEPEAWARLVHAQQRPVRRWTEDDGRPARVDRPHLATRLFFARYPLLGAGRW